ncbi:MAG: hypothetical protein PHR84_02410 [Candidatus Omnitrophica bacterium]|jgi:uncharacterized protein YceK|nr:hypothetical protein [Candidatus Omnitrophota bacterium]MDD5660531.1 hypothetical protein [Candidatus Omnitrophota bacterium]
MKIDMPVIILAAVFLLGGCASVRPVAKVDIIEEDYTYTEEPEICFFPKDKAKWDGYRVTNKNWGRLTDYQKLMFIFEGSKEIEKKKAVIVSLKDTSRTLFALNYGMDMVNKENPDAAVPVIDFFYDILQETKMIAPR